MANNTIWRPQPRQAAFMRRKEFEVFYGGAAGGGKSDALVIEALRQVNVPHYKCLILRKTFPQLRELIDKSLNYYPRAYPQAKYNASAHEWKFSSGAKIIFGSLNRPQDKIQYQGQSYDVIMFDELTHFTYDEYVYLFSRCRPNGSGTECYVRSTGNPGGIGHGWVKERFITAGKPNTTIWEEQSWQDPDGKSHSANLSRVFIPSSVFDNQALLNNDPLYVQRLAAMPEAERKALLYGDWDSFEGQVFLEWRNDSAHYIDRINTHVIEPFNIPKRWIIYCGIDWGYARPFSVGWYAVDDDGILYRIREYYGCTGTPNTGLKLEPTEVARRIKQIEEEDPNLKDRLIHRIGDPAIWGTQTGSSVGELMEKERVYFEKGKHDRLSGLMQCHYRLAMDEEGRSKFYCFSTCKHFIRTIPALVYDESNVEDVDTDGEDHIYDEWRYICMANPISPPIKKETTIKPYDPLNADDDYYKKVKQGRYNFFQKYY